MSLFIWGSTLQWKSISEDLDKDDKISKVKVGGYGALTFIVGFLLGGIILIPSYMTSSYANKLIKMFSQTCDINQF